MPKRALRPRFLALRAQARREWGPAQQAELERRLFSLPAFASSPVLLLYASKADEVPTHDLIRRLLAAGRRVALPVANVKDRSLSLSYLSSLDDLASGPFGVPEPQKERRAACAPSEIGAAVIPGLAFDLRGSRLGHGLGFYDRFLAALACPKIGLCFDAQIADSLPHEPHDHPVDYVVSEKRIIRCPHP